MKLKFKSGAEFTVSGDMLKWYDEKYCLAAVKKDGDALRYVNKNNSFITVTVEE